MRCKVSESEVGGSHVPEWLEGKPIRCCFADPPCVRIASRLDLEETTVRLLNPKPEILAKAVPACLHPSISSGQKDAVVADGAEIGVKAQLKQSTVATGCVVGANARLHRTILLPGASVGAGCQLRSCIVGTGAVVGDKCKVGYILTGNSANKRYCECWCCCREGREGGEPEHRGITPRERMCRRSCGGTCLSKLYSKKSLLRFGVWKVKSVTVR